VRGKLQPAKVENAWREAIASLQLTPDRLQRSSHDSAANGAPAAHAMTLQQPALSLEEHLSTELNHAFSDAPGAWPFRPFLFAGEASSRIGLTYRHCVADSVSIRVLMREWIYRLEGTEDRRAAPLKCESDSYWRLFATRNGSVRMGQTLGAFIRGHHRLRAAQKPATSGAADCLSRVILGDAPPGLITKLRERCQSIGVRVNDVMLAALLETARRHVPLQMRSNRRDVAAGCIVNLRPYADRDLSDTFGIFLGFTSVVGSPRDFSKPKALLESVRKQTAMHRRHGIAPACTMWLNAGLFTGKFMPRRRLYHFYRKSMPLAAGLSSVRIRTEESLGPNVLEYLRVSPTGPIAPAALSTTEMNGRLSLALTYRPALLGEDSARAILDDFVELLRIS
jgi:hypothetical protein